MAGDWIKMRCDLPRSPKVVRMSSALRADRFRVIGGLHAVWSLFDAHSDDGRLDGYTLETLDEMIGFPGIAAAMKSVGWLIDDGDSLSVPRFDEHNGKSAKRRATETERKREARKLSATDADNERTESGPEKRREDIHPHSPQGGGNSKSRRGRKPSGAEPEGFSEWYEAYPRHEARKDAAKAFAAINPDEALQARMQAAVAMQRQSEQWRKDGGRFIPLPATWLRQGRWDDEPVSGAPAPSSTPDWLRSAV